MSQARRLLFISPVMPAQTGNGLAMRAGLFLEALAADHEVTLLVVPVAGPADGRAVPPFVTTHTDRVAVLPHATSDALWEVIGRVGSARFECVHVFRLYMAPFAAPFLRAGGGHDRPVSVLDLDDDEPRTRRRLSALHAQRGRDEAASFEAREAERFERLEREWLGRFDHVLVCSDDDAVRVSGRLAASASAATTTPAAATASATLATATPPAAAVSSAAASVPVAPDSRHATVDVVPNAVRAPELGMEARGAHAGTGDRAAFGFLLVGSFGYFPNEDAALFFGQEIWPRIVAGAPRPARLSIVGSRPGPHVLALAAAAGITVTGAVPTLAPFYAEAHAAVNPVRAGGGTRIKAIEAFAHGVPLVSTSVGAEGLAVEHGRHLLIADGPDEFARACLRLASEPDLGPRLADAARALHRERYALPAVVERIRALYRGLGRRPTALSLTVGGECSTSGQIREVRRNSMDWDACPRVSDGIEINKVADGYIVYQPDRDRVHYLNHTAVLLLELCDGKTRAGDLAGLVKAAYDLAAPPTGEVSECLAKLLEEGLVH